MRNLIHVFVLVLFSFSAHPANIILDLSNSADVEPFFSVDNGGVTLTFSNANLSGDFDSDLDGLVVLDPTGFYFPAISAFELSFDQDVKLISYDVGYLDEYGDESFTIVGNNGFTTESGPWVTGDRFFANNLIVDAGEILAWNSDSGVIGNDGVIQIYSITVSTVVPVPAAAWLFLSALAGLGWMRRKTH